MSGKLLRKREVVFLISCGVVFALLPIISCIYGVHLWVVKLRFEKTSTAQSNYVLFIDDYHDDNSVYPASIEDLYRPGTREKLPWAFEDAWGTRMLYEKRSDGFSIISAGPDKRFHTADDIVTDINKSESR